MFIELIHKMFNHDKEVMHLKIKLDHMKQHNLRITSFFCVMFRRLLYEDPRE